MRADEGAARRDCSELLSTDDTVEGSMGTRQPAIPDGAAVPYRARYSGAGQVTARKPESSPRWRYT